MPGSNHCRPVRNCRDAKSAARQSRNRCGNDACNRLFLCPQPNSRDAVERGVIGLSWQSRPLLEALLRKKATIALSVLALTLCCLHAQTSPYTPNQHKALYLFNFAKYTEWPADCFFNENAPFVLGILGKDTFQADIDIIKGKTIKGRKLVVRYFSSVEDSLGCHMLFICSSETNNLTQILQKLDHRRILTVAEMEGFIEQSGMINLVTEPKSAGSQVVNFEINQEAAKKANLKLDTQLLKLAKRARN